MSYSPQAPQDRRCSPKKSIVREPDGIHLNDKGSKLAADAVQTALDADFGR